MSAQHTPGPWVSEGRRLVNSQAIVISASDGQGPVAFSTTENAPLILAAPDLLQALRDLELAANTVEACYTRNPANFALALRDLGISANVARAAIAKATRSAA